jgi:hypothetical protein
MSPAMTNLPSSFLHNKQEFQNFGLELEDFVDLDHFFRAELYIEQDIMTTFLFLDGISQASFTHIFFLDDIGAIGFEFIPDEIKTLGKMVVFVPEDEHDFVRSHWSSLRTFPVKNGHPSLTV